MSLKVNNPGDHHQVLDKLAGDRIQTQHEQYTHCSQCDRFDVVSRLWSQLRSFLWSEIELIAKGEDL